MRIVAISDTHSRHGDMVLPAGEILVHAGDFTMSGGNREIEHFFEWFTRLPHPHKVMIAGNHDRLFETAPGHARAMVPDNVVYLEDSGCEIEGLKFWGSPWQPWFLDWAFNLSTETELERKWALIPPDTDVLVTHGPPFRILDECFDGRRVGCPALAKRVREINPGLHLFGHIHEGYGRAIDPTGRSDTTYINACVCDLFYRPVNPPVVVEVGED